MKFWLSIVAILFNCTLFAQLPVLSLEQDTLFWINNNTIFNKQHQALYAFQGNIVFQGNSTSYKNVVYSLDIDSLNQKNKALIYTGKGKISLYSIKENTVFYTYDNRDIALATFTNNGETWAAYSMLNDSLLFYIPTTNVKPVILFGVLTAYISSSNIIAELKAKENANSSTYAYIYSINQNAPTWVWDGTYLYPYGVNKFHNMVWEFKENKLSPRNFPRTQEEWLWDGSSLKPYWGGNPQNQWTWQNGVLRQIWNNNYKNEYIIEDNIVRKRFGYIGEPEWEIEGNVPLPIITAVVLGILYR